MSKFAERELKVSFFFAELINKENPVVVDGIVMVGPKKDRKSFNPYNSKIDSFDVSTFALNNGFNINQFKQNIAVKNPAGVTFRRAFAPEVDDRNSNVLDCIALGAGYKE